MRLDKHWIAARIPHQGSMCLLDEAIRWDANRILCRVTGHRLPNHPLRAHGRLGSACGIEFAAQAMAVHGALLAEADGATPPQAGFLASVRGVDFQVARLDDIAADLEVEAERLAGDGNHLLYGFAVRAGERLLLTGRASVMSKALDAAGVLP